MDYKRLADFFEREALNYNEAAFSCNHDAIHDAEVRFMAARDVVDQCEEGTGVVVRWGKQDPMSSNENTVVFIDSIAIETMDIWGKRQIIKRKVMPS